MRDFLTTAIGWQGTGYELYETENGRAVIDVMESRQIDLITIDITMPVMNGLEIMERIDSYKYPCVVSSLTCHDEFEFAKKAIRTDCYGCILKNEIADEIFLELVREISRVAPGEARKEQQYAILETATLRNQQQETGSRTHYWLGHDGDALGEMETLPKEEFGFFKEGQNIILLIMQTVSYQAVVQRYTNNDNAHLFVLFEHTLREQLGGKTYFLLLNEMGDSTTFLGLGKKMPLHGVITGVCEVAEVLSNNPFGIQSRVRYSLLSSSIQEYHIIYRRMRKLEPLTSYPLQESTLCISNYTTDEEEYRKFLREFGSCFQEELQSRNMARVEICYDMAVTQIAQNLYNIRPAGFIHRCETCIHEFLLQYPLAGEMPATEPYREFDSSRECEQSIMDKIRDYCVPGGTQDKNNLVKKAVLLVRQDYSEDTGLEWLVGELWVNSSYLNRLSPQEVGQSLTVYINQYRIEQAEKMISGSNMKLYEVAEKIGFFPFIAFPSVLKKITGETPTEYKRQML